jgi:hypothetical protein
LLLNHTKNLDFLSYVKTDRPQNLELPSFVSDWSLDLSGLGHSEKVSCSVRFDILEIYNAASGTQAEFKVRPRTLAIRGVILDAVQVTAFHTVDGAHQADDECSALTDLLDEVLTIAAIPPREKDLGLSKCEAFWMTMIVVCRADQLNMPT